MFQGVAYMSVPIILQCRAFIGRTELVLFLQYVHVIKFTTI